MFLVHFDMKMMSLSQTIIALKKLPLPSLSIPPSNFCPPPSYLHVFPHRKASITAAMAMRDCSFPDRPLWLDGSGGALKTHVDPFGAVSAENEVEGNDFE